ncbi:MAG: LOG family protein [Roseinatronobacter sp.]
MTFAPKSVCVFCGARTGRDPAHAKAARAVGEMIARRGYRLVFGAGDIGIMGAVADAAQGAGGAVLGVIPDHLIAREAGRRDHGTLVRTETMHERKKVMFDNSDAVVVLPGGAGTLDEFFEVLTWRQIGLHEKPIFLLNVAGFWTPLEALVEHVIAQGFAAPLLRDFFVTSRSVADLESALVKALDR